MTGSSVAVLVVDDDNAIRRMLKMSLKAHGYEVREADCGVAAIDSARQCSPQAVFLDLGLPDLDGVQVTRQLRTLCNSPIIILSVRGHERDKIEALDAGADDYLTKPFGVGELLARLRVALRRAAAPAVSEVFENGELRVDLGRRLVHLGAQEVHLTPTEHLLLRSLVLSAGKVITHDQLLRQVWGEPYQGEHHLLRMNISNLRRKIEPDPVRPSYVVTEAGVGYRFKLF